MKFNRGRGGFTTTADMASPFEEPGTRGIYPQHSAGHIAGAEREHEAQSTGAVTPMQRFGAVRVGGCSGRTASSDGGGAGGAGKARRL